MISAIGLLLYLAVRGIIVHPAWFTWYEHYTIASCLRFSWQPEFLGFHLFNGLLSQATGIVIGNIAQSHRNAYTSGVGFEKMAEEEGERARFCRSLRITHISATTNLLQQQQQHNTQYAMNDEMKDMYGTLIPNNYTNKQFT